MAPAHQILKVDMNGNWTTLIDHASGQLNFPTNCAFGGPGLQDLYFATWNANTSAESTPPSRGHPALSSAVTGGPLAFCR
jgi:sugar lactone lactonase YvrE